MGYAVLMNRTNCDSFRARTLAGLLATLLFGQAQAGDIDLLSLAWKQPRGNATTLRNGLITDVELDQRSASIEVRCPTGDRAVGQGNLRIVVQWVPDAGETAPKTLSLDLFRRTVMTAEGNGNARAETGKEIIDRIDGSYNDLSGSIGMQDPLTFTAPLVLSKGRYIATFDVPSDRLTAIRNTRTRAITYAKEILTVARVQGGT